MAGVVVPSLVGPVPQTASFQGSLHTLLIPQVIACQPTSGEGRLDKMNLCSSKLYLQVFIASGSMPRRFHSSTSLNFEGDEDPASVIERSCVLVDIDDTED